MPESLDRHINKEKNKIAGGGAWLWLLKVYYTDSDILYLVNNIEDVTYQGQVYTRCNFNMSAYDRSEPGRLAEVTLEISNTELATALLPYVEDYDGLVGQTIVRTPVNANWLSIDMSAKAEEFIVTSCSAGEEWLAFVLGASNPLNKRFPLTRYFGLHCRYVANFKGLECGYSGAETTCNGTPADCMARSNFYRFGGQLGLRSKTIKFA